MTGSSRMAEQISEDGIQRLVDRFYRKVRADPELGPIFEGAIARDWAPHLATIRDLWSSVMLTTGRYKGNPVAVHLRIDAMEPSLFERWLELFGETCSELFEDSAADALRTKAARIAESLKLSLFYRPERAWPGRRERVRRYTRQVRPILLAKSRARDEQTYRQRQLWRCRSRSEACHTQQLRTNALSRIEETTTEALRCSI